MATSCRTCQITLSTPQGQTNAVTFTYAFPAPVLTAVTPNVGPTTGGTQVTLTGSNVNVGPMTVMFDGISTTPISGNGPDSITVVAPEHTAGAVDVTIANSSGGSSTLTQGYTYE